MVKTDKKQSIWKKTVAIALTLLILYSVGSYIIATLYWTSGLEIDLLSFLFDVYFPEDVLIAAGLVPADFNWSVNDKSLFILFSYGSLIGIFILAILAILIGKLSCGFFVKIVIKTHMLLKSSAEIIEDKPQEKSAATQSKFSTWYEILTQSLPLMFATYGVSLAVMPHMERFLVIEDEYYYLVTSMYVAALVLLIIVPLYYAIWLLDNSALRVSIPDAREKYSVGGWIGNYISGYTGFMVIITLIRLVFDWVDDFSGFFRDNLGLIVLPLSLYSIPAILATIYYRRGIKSQVDTFIPSKQ